jgi:hypothetical protein
LLRNEMFASSYEGLDEFSTAMVVLFDKLHGMAGEGA